MLAIRVESLLFFFIFLLPHFSLVSVLQEYLQGKVDTTDAIDLVPPVPLPAVTPSLPPAAAVLSAAAAAAPGAAAGSGPPPVKAGDLSASLVAAGEPGSTWPVGGEGEERHDGTAGPGTAVTSSEAGAGAAAALPPSKRFRAAKAVGATASLSDGDGGGEGAAADRGVTGGEEVETERRASGLEESADGGTIGSAKLSAAGVDGRKDGRVGETEDRASDAALLAVMARERAVRDSDAALLCARKRNVFASVLAMLNRRDAEKKKMEAAMQVRGEEREGEERRGGKTQEMMHSH